jgi:hypothetical protein
MNLPNLPTDNLYKFMALSGLAIFLFSIVFPLSQIHDIKLKMVEIETQQEVLKLEVEQIGNDVMDALATKGVLNTKKQALFRNYLNDLFKRNNNKELSKDWSKGEPILNIKEQAIFRKQLNEIKKRLAKIMGEEKKVMILYNELNTYYRIIWIGGLFGLIISFIGFGLWYILIQKPNDMLLQKQIKAEG